MTLTSRHMSQVPFEEHYVVRSGAHGYGLDDKDSDLDLRGFFIPDEAESVLGFIASPGHFTGEGDTTLWDIRKFFALAAKANPNVLETLFVEPEDVVSETHIASEVRKNRDMFLSKRIAVTTVGYASACIARLKKKWDAKDCSHAFRLLNMGTECMATGRLRVKRTGKERDFLLACKRGEIPPGDEMMAGLKTAEEDLRSMVAKCQLPDEPDEKALNSLCASIVMRHVTRRDEDLTDMGRSELEVGK